MYLTTSAVAAGISYLMPASAVLFAQKLLAVQVPVTGTIWQHSTPAMMPLPGALEWTLLVLLALIALVSLRILLTRKKFKEELHKLSDIEKDS